MRNARNLAIVLLALAPQVPFPAAAGGEPQPAGIERLAWLAGCWQRAGEDRVTEERWMAPRGNAMLGLNRTVAGDRMVGYEFLRIEEQDGGLVLTATPSGQREATFRKITLTESMVVFENRAHDFPQRIIYRRLPDGSLLGRIEGEDDGKIRGVDFPMERTRCDPEAAGND